MGSEMNSCFQQILWNSNLAMLPLKTTEIMPETVTAVMAGITKGCKATVRIPYPKPVTVLITDAAAVTIQRKQISMLPPLDQFGYFFT